MTFSQLEYFLAVVECSSFSLAAEEVYLSQSSLSKHIKSLENELGNKLFIRHGTKMHLTPAGEFFLSFVKKTNNEYRTMLSQLSRYTTSQLRTLKVGSLPLLPEYNLISRLSKFQSQNMTIHLKIYERDQCTIIRMLDNHQLDLAIARTDFLTADKYDFIPIHKDTLSLVCSTNHHLAQREMISLADLKQEQFIILDTKSSVYYLFYNECLKNDFIPNITFTISLHYPLIGMISENMGVSVLPRQLVDLNAHSNITCIPLSDNIHTTTSIIKRKMPKTEPYIDKLYFFVSNTINMED